MLREFFPAHSKTVETGFRGKEKGNVLWESESHMVGILNYILPVQIQEEREEIRLGRVRRLLSSCDEESWPRPLGIFKGRRGPQRATFPANSRRAF